MNSQGTEVILADVEMKLALSLADAAVGNVPAPRITLAMVRLCQHLARIAKQDGSHVNLVPIYAAAIVQDRVSFVALFHTLFSRAESVIVADH